MREVHLSYPHPQRVGGEVPRRLNNLNQNIMANINLSQESYVDYVGSLYFRAMNVDNCHFTPKFAPQTEKNPVPAILVHCSGVQRTSGVIVNFDMWPREDFDAKDLEALFTKKSHIEKVDGKDTEVIDGYEPKGEFSDIHFRIGYWPEIDKDGNPTIREGKPKWIAYVSNGDVKKLAGGEREYVNRTV